MNFRIQLLHAANGALQRARRVSKRIGNFRGPVRDARTKEDTFDACVGQLRTGVMATADR
jgi:hypothetical protein